MSKPTPLLKLLGPKKRFLPFTLCLKQSDGYFHFILLVLLVFTQFGCRYALGPGEELPYDSVYVQVVHNDSTAPQAGPLLSRALREEMIREGRTKLVNNPSSADASLTVRLIDYERLPEMYRSDDTALASGFRMSMFALATLQSSSGKKIYFKDKFFRSAASAMRNNLTESPRSRQPMMSASRILARDICAFVNHFSW